VEHGTTEFRLPEILKVEPVSDHGNPVEIAAKFGGADQLKNAVETMQTLLYAE
jgi:type I restriction enzyme R subunit